MSEFEVIGHLIDAARAAQKAGVTKVQFLKRSAICWDNIEAAFEAINTQQKEDKK